MNLERYQTLVFDCDGVILDSNRVKTDAFYHAAMLYGETAAQALVDWHVANGGVSRYSKFAYFLEHIVPMSAEGPDLESLLCRFADAVQNGLCRCAVAPGLAELRRQTTHARWLVVSGGDQSELRKVLANRGLDRLFDGGIFGSPDTKDEILARELQAGIIKQPALFLGDSVYDHRAACAAGLDFIFISGWTEIPDWRAFITKFGLRSVGSISDII